MTYLKVNKQGKDIYLKCLFKKTQRKNGLAQNNEKRKSQEKKQGSKNGIGTGQQKRINQE